MPISVKIFVPFMRLAEKLTLGIEPCFAPVCVVASLTKEIGCSESDIFDHFESAEILQVTIIDSLDDRIQIHIVWAKAPLLTCRDTFGFCGEEGRIQRLEHCKMLLIISVDVVDVAGLLTKKLLVPERDDAP
jgi:hypothetical protein